MSSRRRKRRRSRRTRFAEAFARHVRDENIMLVADMHGFPVGQAWIDLTKRQSERVGYIWAVRVFPFLRGLGVGTRLMESAEQELRSRAIRVWTQRALHETPPSTHGQRSGGRKRATCDGAWKRTSGPS